ncbi:MAG TPA: hypothetical protein VM938_08215 [Acidimicrobiales bacterium]|nr:hypothetical protein [Acidimicrobiales bacterium]
MRNVRAAVAAVTTVVLVGAASSFGSASAATAGVGTADVTTTVVGVALGTDGSVLGVRLLGDDARATIDPAVSAPEAFSRLTGVEVSSELVDALNLSSGAAESKQPGGDESVTIGSLNLSEPATGVTIPEAVLSGTLGAASLSSAASAASSTAGLDAALTDAAVAGGLATLEGVTSDVETAATSAASTGTRAVKIDQVVVLDLGSLLAGLNISLGDLPLDLLTDLLDELGVPVGDLATGEAVDTAVAALNAQIDELQAAAAATTPALPTGETVQTIVGTVNGIGLGEVINDDVETAITDLTDVTAQLDTLIEHVQGTLTTLIDDVLAVLDGVALLEVNGVEVGVTTKAADTVENSVAEVTAKLGGLKVGGVAVDGIDLASHLADINAAVNTVNDTIGGVLGVVHADLADLVDVKVFERAADHGVTSAGGYVEAVDGITALSATITPPEALADIVATVTGLAGSVEETLEGLGASAVLDGLDAAMGLLGAEVDATEAGALADGGNVTLASITSTSNFAPSAPIIPGTGTENDRSLAATGTNAVPLTALAMLLIALGLGFREWVRMPVRRATR